MANMPASVQRHLILFLNLMANMPASVHTLRNSAPVELGHNLASSSYLRMENNRLFVHN